MKRILAAWPVLCALASGAMFSMALPPSDAEWLGWVALTPLLIAVSVPGRRRLHAFGLGGLTGLTTGLVDVGLGDGVAPDRMNLAYLPFIWIGIVFGVACLIVSISVRRWPDLNPLLRTAGIACAGVAAEWMSTLSPLPVSIALCEHRAVAVLQIASVAGIWGVSFLLWLTNAAAADIVLRRRITAPAVLAVAVVLAATIGGRMRLERADASIAANRYAVATVAATQDYSGEQVGGDPSGARGSSADEPDNLTLIRRAAAGGARLIVGSEEAFGTAYTPDNPKSDPATAARLSRTCLVVGYQAFGNPKDRNCAALIGPDGTARAIHRKIHLFLGERTAVEAGDTPTVGETGDPLLGRIGILICFDTCWTDLTRAVTAGGARLLAVPDYDPPTPRAVLHQMHEAMMPFRAVENEIALVRSDPTGLSEIVDPWGRVIAQAPMYRAEAVVGRTPLGDGQGGTFFTRWGDWLAYLCVAATGLGLIAAVAPVRRQPSAAAG